MYLYEYKVQFLLCTNPNSYYVQIPVQFEYKFEFKPAVKFKLNVKIKTITMYVLVDFNLFSPLSLSHHTSDSSDSPGSSTAVRWPAGRASGTTTAPPSSRSLEPSPSPEQPADGRHTTDERTDSRRLVFRDHSRDNYDLLSCYSIAKKFDRFYDIIGYVCPRSFATKKEIRPGNIIARNSTQYLDGCTLQSLPRQIKRSTIIAITS